MIYKYTYIMRKNKDLTFKGLEGIDARILDLKIYKAHYRYYDNKKIYGRIIFDRKLELWDAMNAGLVPTLKEK